MKISHLLEEKEKRNEATLVTISDEATVLDAIRALCQNRVGALLVVGEDGQLIGIISERDVLFQCCKNHAGCDRVAVASIMTRNPLVAHPTDTVEDALQIMTAKRVRHLPIIENDQIVGIVSLGDVLRRLYRQDELKIRYLGDYLGGTYGLRVY